MGNLNIIIGTNAYDNVMYYIILNAKWYWYQRHGLAALYSAGDWRGFGSEVTDFHTIDICSKNPYGQLKKNLKYDSLLSLNIVYTYTVT